MAKSKDCFKQPIFVHTVFRKTAQSTPKNTSAGVIFQ